ncbi:MAG TPA: 1,4-dihydroxy-2-naphthoate polyprenyltransferase [Acidimicrobiales bacterium]|jgi:1,4-dihydroxy-2-naphthoate octaprenyltransferase|nr:1,4-dihydroxy-2-naphthoate polyprenyltransferase [Acidimicrobiales bacterium]
MIETPGVQERWVLAARPRTLPAAGVPVVVGTLLIRPLSINWLNSVLCLIIALSLQVATNYANDYSDGIRGTDEQRVGPFRLTVSKLVAAKSVRNAAGLCFAVAAVAGLWLASRTSWWLVLIGLSAMLAGWFYTGGPKPYGYYGFGELFVFIYFGLVATVGTAYVQHGTIPARAWWLGVAVGFMACALLEANNLRDVDGDRAVGKKTLAARLGRQRGAWLYVVCVAGVIVGVVGARQLGVVVATIVLYAPALRLAFSKKQGRELIILLQYSARAQLALGALLGVLLASNAYWG